jgi:hypothetical protein
MKSQTQISDDLATAIEAHFRDTKPRRSALQSFILNWLLDNNVRFLEVEGIEEEFRIYDMNRAAQQIG